MAPGLKKLLELIKTTPSDQRLVDRFVSLSLELTSDERVDAMIRLATILATKAPVKAIDIAWGLFKQDRLQPESLKIVATALETLGKNARAATVLEDVKRLTANPAGTHAHESARSSIQQAIVAALTDDAGGDFSEIAQTKTSQKPIENVTDEKFGGKNEGAPSFSLESTGVHLDAVKAPSAVTPMIPEANHAPMEKQVVERQENFEKKNVLDINPVASVARASAAAPGAGIPEAIPKKELSSHSKAFHERLERDDVLQVTRSSGVEAPRGTTMPTPKDPARCRLFVKELISSSRWADLLSFFEESFEDKGDPLIMELLKTNELTKIDIQFAALWIDTLVCSRQERRALRFMHQLLIEEPQLAWAKLVRSKVDLVTERLRLVKITWREVDGVSALRLQIEQLRPKLGVYVATPPIAS